MVRNLLISLFAFAFFGCYSAKKADKQLDKVMNTYPEKVALLASNKFPCEVGSDTVITVEYDFIEVLDTIPIISKDTIIDTLETTIIKRRIVRLPSEKVIITKYVTDSAKIYSLENQLRECNSKGISEKDSKTNFPKILALLFALLGIVAYFVAKKK